MSLNKPLYLKLQLGDDIRKVSVLPASFAALSETITGLFGSGPFCVKYKDEEGDWVTVANDADLQAAFQTAQGPSLRMVVSQGFGSIPRPPPSDYIEVNPPLDAHGEEEKQPEEPEHGRKRPWKCALKKVKKFLGPMFGKKKCRYQSFVQQLVRQEVSAALGIEAPPLHLRIRCDGCNQCPLAGVRYKCTVCPNFDLCEVCEATAAHPHPMLKINDPEMPVPSVQCTMRKLDEKTTQRAFKNFQRAVKVPKPKMDFVRHHNLGEDSEVPTGACIAKSWVVRNPGPTSWPEGVTVEAVKGFESKACAVQPLAAGQEAVITCDFSTPQQEGKVKGLFRMKLPDGRKFGEKLRAHLQVKEPRPYQYQLDLLRSMGFDSEDSVLNELLEKFGGDYEKVLSVLFEKL